MGINIKYFKKLVPEIVKVGDIYLSASSFGMGILKVTDLHSNHFGFSGENISGNHFYGQSSGILLKERNGKLKLFLKDHLLTELKNQSILDK